MSEFSAEGITDDEADAAWIALWGASEVNEGLTVVGLDLGNRSAWALVHSGGEVRTTGWFDTDRKGEGGGMKYWRFAKFVDELLDNLRPDVVAYEEVSGSPRGASNSVALRQMGILEAALARKGIPYASINPMTLKKWATGSGKSKKKDMIAALRSRYP